MPRFSLEATATLPAPREVVWSRLTDRESVSGWLDDIDHLTGTGERFTTHRANGSGEHPIEGRILELVPERRLRLVVHGPWRLLREVELKLDLESEESATRVAFRACFHLRWLGWLVLPLVRLRAEIALHRAARGFRAAIENEVTRRRHARRERSDSRRRSVRDPNPLEALLRTASG